MSDTLSSKKIAGTAALSGVVAALYIVLVYVNAGASFGPFQIRIAEALTLLPFLFPATIPGIFVGCFIANFLSPIQFPFDMIFGSLASLLAALLTARCKNRWVAAAPPVLINAIVVGAMLAIFYHSGSDVFWIAFLTNAGLVAFGQIIACYGLGVPLTICLEKLKPRLALNRR